MRFYVAALIALFFFFFNIRYLYYSISTSSTLIIDGIFLLQFNVGIEYLFWKNYYDRVSLFEFFIAIKCFRNN